MTRPFQRRRSRAEETPTQLARLRDALAWYADPDKYKEHRTPLAAGGVRIDPPEVLQDQGRRARWVLATPEAREE